MKLLYFYNVHGKKKYITHNPFTEAQMISLDATFSHEKNLSDEEINEKYFHYGNGFYRERGKGSE